MKVGGIIFLVLGIFVVLVMLYGISTQPEHADRLMQPLFTGIAFIGIGVYMNHRANDNKKEAEERDKWNREA